MDNWVHYFSVCDKLSQSNKKLLEYWKTYNRTHTTLTRHMMLNEMYALRLKLKVINKSLRTIINELEKEIEV